MSETAEREQFNTLIRELVENVENEDFGAADKAIIELVQRRSQELYFAVGHLTRDVHESITDLIDKCGEIVDPGGISAIAKEKVPDARERLSYVMEKTEYASEKTVESIAATQPVVDEILTSVKDLENTELDDASRVKIARTIADNGRKIQQGLTEAMMAQQHQTLASQVVTKTFNLICEIESKMVALVAVAGNSTATETNDRTRGSDEPYGPAIGHEDDVVNGQEDVDELLSSLGF